MMIVERRLARARQTGSLCALIALSVFGFACSKSEPVRNVSPQAADNQGGTGTKGKALDPTYASSPAAASAAAPRDERERAMQESSQFGIIGGLGHGGGGKATGPASG